MEGNEWKKNMQGTGTANLFSLSVYEGDLDENNMTWHELISLPFSSR